MSFKISIKKSTCLVTGGCYSNTVVELVQENVNTECPKKYTQSFFANAKKSILYIYTHENICK